MKYKRIFIPNSFVHIIIVVYNRKNIFIENIKLLQDSLKNSKKYFNYEIIAISVLPNHIHMILNPRNIKEYPKIITAIKYYFSRNYAVGVETPTYGYLNKGEKGIFQRRYFEHTISSEQDLNKHIDYIHYNPVKHELVNNVRDWQYSSFHKFVKQNMYDINWGNCADIKNIIELDYE